VKAGDIIIFWGSIKFVSLCYLLGVHVLQDLLQRFADSYSNSPDTGGQTDMTKLIVARHMQEISLHRCETKKNPRVVN
jgi:hypothetical protein